MKEVINPEIKEIIAYEYNGRLYHNKVTANKDKYIKQVRNILKTDNRDMKDEFSSSTILHNAETLLPVLVDYLNKVRE